MATWLERYEAGERRRVWDELHALGPLDAVPEATRRDAEGVADRTMQRAAINLRAVHDRLVAAGFRFDLPEFAYLKMVGNRNVARAMTPPPEDEPIWLVDYLRIYCDAGGFRQVAGTESYPLDVTRRLAEGLLEL